MQQTLLRAIVKGGETARTWAFWMEVADDGKVGGLVGKLGEGGGRQADRNESTGWSQRWKDPLLTFSQSLGCRWGPHSFFRSRQIALTLVGAGHSSPKEIPASLCSVIHFIL